MILPQWQARMCGWSQSPPRQEERAALHVIARSGKDFRNVRGFHVPEPKGYSRQGGGELLDVEVISLIHARHLLGQNRKDDVVLMQNPIVLDVVKQGGRNVSGAARDENRGSGDALHGTALSRSNELVQGQPVLA